MRCEASSGRGCGGAAGEREAGHEGGGGQSPRGTSPSREPLDHREVLAYGIPAALFTSSRFSGLGFPPVVELCLFSQVDLSRECSCLGDKARGVPPPCRSPRMPFEFYQAVAFG